MTAITLAVLLVIGNTEILAQTRSPGEAGADGARVVYDAAFYRPFAPRTALDMVRQTPGFVPAADDAEQRRGFAGAVGNVLVDGERLSAKSQTLSDVLQRIPAQEVLRIEILRGSEVAGDASGATVLANVVRTPSTGGGAWGLGTEVANEGEPAPNGWFGWGGRRGVTEYSLGGNTYALQRRLPGEREIFDADGARIARRRDASPREFSEYALNGQASRSLAAGRLAFTGQVAYSRYADQSSSLTLAPEGGRIGDESIPYAETDRTAEAGLTYARPLGSWDLEIGALVTRKRHRDRVTATRFDAAGAQSSVFQQRQSRDSGETILRSTLRRAADRGSFEVGTELAVNTLDGGALRTLDLGGGPFPILVPNANLRVKETRGEAFVSHARSLDERWSLDARLAAEVSRLAFTGDTEQSVSLRYLKPRLQVTRALGRHRLQLRAFRDVSQLDFEDFVSSVEVDDELVNGGNPDLEPQTAWALEMDADLRFSAAALRVRAFRHWLDDVADFVPVGPPGERLDAPGNIGRGDVLGVEVSLRLPLDKLLDGGSLTVAGTLRDAEVRDPVTAEARTISDFPEEEVKAELRQDLSSRRLAWGVAFTGEGNRTDYRLAEIDRHRKSSSLDAFVETTAFAGLKIRLTMLSILGDPEMRSREFYAPDRAGAPFEREISDRSPGHWWLLSISGAL